MGAKKKSKYDSKVNVIAFAVIIISVLAVWSCGHVFYKTVFCESACNEYNAQWYKNTVSMYLEEARMDSLLRVGKISDVVIIKRTTGIDMIKNDTTRNDTIKNVYILPLSNIDKIIEGQKIVMQRQDAMAQDLRQESNNLINKMNGWLGFWLGIMAIIGVFVPIALQIKLYRSDRDREERAEQRIKALESYIKEKLIKERDVYSKEIKESIKGLNIEKERYTQEMRLISYSCLVRNFQYVLDNPEIKTNEYRDRLLTDIWKDMVDNLQKIITDFCESKHRNGDIYDIKIALVLMMEALTQIRMASPRRVRAITNLKEETKQLIISIFEPIKNIGYIKDRLNNYCESLRDIRIQK